MPEGTSIESLRHAIEMRRKARLKALVALAIAAPVAALVAAYLAPRHPTALHTTVSAWYAYSQTLGTPDLYVFLVGAPAALVVLANAAYVLFATISNAFDRGAITMMERKSGA